MPKLWKIAVEAPIPQLLTYEVSEDLLLKRGDVISVPLGKRLARGLAIAKTEELIEEELKTISAQENFWSLPENFIQWLEWVSDYYQYPLGMLLASVFPKLKEKPRKPESLESQASRPPDLTPEQVSVTNQIQLDQGFQRYLVHGVTGSGKTEVYLNLFEKTLKAGKRGLLLVPEIALTPQLIERFSGRFPGQISFLHSQLTEREWTDQWYSMIRNEKSILIGARSALFCPVDKWDLIVIDEEHEPSFKQEEKLRYHARDSAIVMAQKHNCPILLGSATPSLESWKNVTDGKFKLLTMANRVENRSLPDVEIIDLRKEEKSTIRPFWLSEKLYQLLSENFKEGNQSVLFLNRRGVSQVVMCRSCGFTKDCPSCDISLTLHSESDLICHYCGYQERLKSQCPNCKEGEIVGVGLGTEKVEKEIQSLFPTARLSRADRDEIQNRAELEGLIHDMENEEIDILIGTQMIAKGLDFKKLKLVGVLLADIGFNLPDFRSTERSFQLLTQVSGRAGRHGTTTGKVLIQTYNPDHPSLQYVVNHNYTDFANFELSNREALNYPPFGKLVNLRFQSRDQSKAKEASELVAKWLRSQGSLISNSLSVLGPIESPIFKLRGLFRFQILLKTQKNFHIQKVLAKIPPDFMQSGVRLIVDVDPLSLL